MIYYLDQFLFPTDLKIPVTNCRQESYGLMVLASDIFCAIIEDTVFHHVVRWQLMNQQQGTHSIKPTMRLVPQWECGMGRKHCWRQKGTGRARHEMYQGAQISLEMVLPCMVQNHKVMLSSYKKVTPARPVDCNFSSCSRREGKRLLWVRNDGAKIVETSEKVIMIVETSVKGNIM